MISKAYRHLLINRCRIAYKKHYGPDREIYTRTFKSVSFGTILMIFDKTDQTRIFPNDLYTEYAEFIISLETGEILKASSVLPPLTKTEKILYETKKF